MIHPQTERRTDFTANAASADLPVDDSITDDGASGSYSEDYDDGVADQARAAADPTKNFASENLARLKVGLSAGDPAVLTNNRLGELSPDFIRPFAPWNTLARPTLRSSRFWLDWQAKAREPAVHLHGDVAIGRDATIDNGGTKTINPATYRKQLTRIFQAHGDPDGNGDPSDGAINNVMAWNEPNFKKGSNDPKVGDPLRNNPWRAARLWIEAMKACFPDAQTTYCGTSRTARGLVVAGDFAGEPLRTKTGKRNTITIRVNGRKTRVYYPEAYANHLFALLNHKHAMYPQAWSFHTYSDTRRYLFNKGATRYDAPETRRFYRLYRNPDFEYSRGGSIKPQIWLTETGVPYATKCSGGAASPCGGANLTNTLLLGMRHQRNALAFLLSRIAKSYSSGAANAGGKINRVYYLNLLSNAGKCQSTATSAALRCNQDEFGLIGYQDDTTFRATVAGGGTAKIKPFTRFPAVISSDVSASKERRLSFCILWKARTVMQVKSPNSVTRKTCPG